MKDYHDYVFKDGKLVGDFDNMYIDCEDPWKQSKRHHTLEIRIMNEVLSEKKYERVLDLGCGLGNISNIINHHCELLDACDISQTAIEKAKLLYPNINFFSHDILSESFPLTVKYDLIVLSGTLWYIVDNIDAVFLKIKKLLKTNGEFLVALPFPDITQKFYGKDIIGDENGLYNKFSSYFQIDTFLVLREKEKITSPTVLIKGFKNE